MGSFFFFLVNAMRFDVLVCIVGSHGNNWMILCIIRIVHIFQSHCLFSLQTNTNVRALTATRVPSTTHEWEMSWKSIFVLYLSACAGFQEECTTDQSPEPHFVTSQWWYKATSNCRSPCTTVFVSPFEHVQCQFKQKANTKLKQQDALNRGLSLPFF